MLILAIETTTHCGSVALLRDDMLLGCLTLNTSRTHSQRLLRDTDFLMKECGVTPDAIEGVAVSLGPGSFTGVRIGLSFAKGFAFAAARPIAGVPTLKAMALRCAEPQILLCTVMDARRGEIFSAIWRMNPDTHVLEEIRPARAESLDAFLEEVTEPALFAGDGGIKFAERIRGRLGDRARFAQPGRNLPSAEEVAVLGREMLLDGRADDVALLKPIYLRTPDCNPRKEKAE